MCIPSSTLAVNKSSDRLDSEFRESYFRQLVAQFEILPDPATRAAITAAAKAANAPQNDTDYIPSADYDRVYLKSQALCSEIAVQTRELSWDDVYRLEVALVSLKAAKDLRRSAWTLRSEFEQLANQNEVARYKESKPPDAEKGDILELRSDLVQLQQELHWRYTAMWILEAFRAPLLGGVVGSARRCLIWYLGFFTALLIIALESSLQATEALSVCEGLTAVLLVFMAGTMGSLISVWRRIQTAPMNGNADLDLLDLEQSQSSIYLLPFIGGAFAFVLYLLFSSQLISGSLFPVFDKGKGWAILLIPDGTMNYSKLVVWAFVAGFAERFVPDALDRLASQAQKTQSPIAQTTSK